MLAVTIDNLPGFEIKEVIGEVLGVVARPRNAYFEGVKNLGGGVDPNVTIALARAREVAVADMLRVAYRRGANAVIGMRFDHRAISDGWNEICAYGTAVFVTPVPPPPPVVAPPGQAQSPPVDAPRRGRLGLPPAPPG